MGTIGDRIKFWRKERGLTQGELGEMVGLSTTAIMRYEKNMREPRAQAFHAIAEALRVSEDYLLGKTDDPLPFTSAEIEKNLELLERYKRTGITPEAMSTIIIAAGDPEKAKRVIELAEADANGRIVVLPLAPGTHVWVLERKASSPPTQFDFFRERVVNSYGVAQNGFLNMQLMVPDGAYPYPVHDLYPQIKDIGRTIFLTREEAEAALDKKEKENLT